ncbi:hypothetical protein AAFF_G00182610 [Aldrovandia affinis]|uniref:Uncharacterized protein n=1 Tax=Aldrovandia affinis TaxID=143900 RepID=A0AAD7RKC5_9TELE|nr:hypothetical protein AAFF_G00182610 [Aldrovandia affinis]
MLHRITLPERLLQHWSNDKHCRSRRDLPPDSPVLENIPTLNPETPQCKPGVLPARQGLVSPSVAAFSPVDTLKGRGPGPEGPQRVKRRGMLRQHSWAIVRHRAQWSRLNGKLRGGLEREGDDGGC